MVNARGNITTQVFDALNRLQATQDALNNRTTYGYDKVGNRNYIQDPAGYYVTMSYDGRRSLLSMQDQNAYTTSYTYDQIGRKSTRQTALGDLTTYSYDRENRIASTAYADATVYTYGYDANSNLTTATDVVGSITFTYDQLDRITGRTDPGSLSQAYSYDKVGNKLTLKDPDSRIRTLSYDSSSRLTTAITPDGAMNTWLYDSLNRVVTIQQSSPTFTYHYNYDKTGNITSLQNYDLNGTFALGFTYTYDPNNNRLTLRDSSGTITTYAYDAVDRLTQDSTVGLNTHTYSYTYDSRGNMTYNSETGTFSYDAGNRKVTGTISNSLSTFTYDHNGNMTGVNEAVALTMLNYDKENRLSAHFDAGGTVTTNIYDPLGKKRAWAKSTGTRSTIVWDGEDYVQVRE